MPLFLAHHERIFDRVVVIVHNSGIGLPQDSDRVAWLYLDEFSFYQPFGWNYAFERERANEFDFAFFLDSDEFLSVRSADELQKFLRRRRFHCGFYLHWRPVIPPLNFDADLTPESLSRFKLSSELAGTRKIVYNIGRTAFFSAAHGNHVYNGKKKFLSRFRADERDISLLHMPFVSLASFRQKILSNPTDEFYDKIIKTSPYFAEKYGEAWYENALSDDDFAYLCLNYRERNQERHISLQDAALNSFPNFHLPEARFRYWKEEFNRLPSVDRRLQPRPGEIEFVRQAIKRGYRNSSDILSDVREDEGRILRFAI
jgi:hypothetical protein